MMDKEGQSYLIKAGAAWSGVGLSKYLSMMGIETWGDAAAAAAFVYSLVLIGEWVYNKLKKK